MLSFILRLFGNFGFKNRDEAIKILVLALCAFFVTGAQWPIRTLKDSLLVGEIGADSQPIMRLLSVVMCFSISLLYGQLVSFLRREVVLYLVVGFLTGLGLIFYGLLTLTLFGSLAAIKDLIVRSFYLYAEGFIVLTLPVFWAFVNDISTAEESRRYYGYLVFAAQFGALVAILFSLVLSENVANVPIISLISTGFLILFALLIFWLLRNVPPSQLRGYAIKSSTVAEKHNIPFLKGLFLLLASPYVAGIFFLTIAPEVLTAIVNFKFLKVVEFAFLNHKERIVTYMFNYSLLIQLVSCACALLGSFFYDWLGTKNCIIIYPLCFIVAVLFLAWQPTLFVVTGVLVFIKGLNYGINKPAREGLYIPTTKEVKYKSKAWIEVFGSRIFKATGASICKLSSSFISSFLLLMPILWTMIAFLVGKRYEKCILDNETIV